MAKWVAPLSPLKVPEKVVPDKEVALPIRGNVSNTEPSPNGSASVVEISKTFVWPLVTSTLVERSTNVGALSLRLFMLTRTFGEVADKEGREILTTSYKVGDMVQVISGPFIDFAGHIEEVNDEKQKVKVVVSIFGRPTSVELDCFQIEAQK